MKHIKLFESFNGFPSTKEEIIKICQEYNIVRYTINEDMSIDVDGDVDLWNCGLSKMPLKFNKVRGNFWCHSNSLTTLEGAPKEVGGFFTCNDNKLTTLLGGPNDVGGSFNCSNNELTTLEGAPYNASTTWGGYFNCDNNKLVSLLGAPKVDLFSCVGNRYKFYNKAYHLYTNITNYFLVQPYITFY